VCVCVYERTEAEAAASKGAVARLEAAEARRAALAQAAAAKAGGGGGAAAAAAARDSSQPGAGPKQAYSGAARVQEGDGQGQEYIGSGGRLRGLFDQFEQVCVVMSESTYAVVCCNVFAEWAGAGVHRVRWPLAGPV